jgi:hypothetical protein
MSRPLRVLAGALPALALLGLLRPPAARGDDEAPRPAPPAAEQPGDPGAVRGRAYFEQAVQFVNDGKPGIHTVENFFVDLADVQITDGRNTHSGYLRLWFATPDRFRWEQRPSAEMTGVTTKILSGDQLWIVTPDNRLQRMHGSAEGLQAIEQLKADRKRLYDLARFLTLEGLKGPGVEFQYEGVARGSLEFAGERLKVRRRIPGGGDMIFYLAMHRGADGQVTARQPEIVTLVGNPERNEPTEIFLLTQWTQGPQFRYPSRIQAFRQATPSAAPTRFLLAFPSDIRVNAEIAAGIFEPPR